MNAQAKVSPLTQHFKSSASQPKCRRRKRLSPITFRLTDKERAELMKRSKGIGVSAYIRKCLSGKNAARRKHQFHTPVADEKSIARALAMLGSSRIANNLNQLAYHADTGSLLVDEETRRKTDEAYQHVGTLRKELIVALGLKADVSKS